MVPVGGSIVAGGSEQVIRGIGEMYAGRASIYPVLDLLTTLLGWGEEGYRDLLIKRKVSCSNY